MHGNDTASQKRTLTAYQVLTIFGMNIPSQHLIINKLTQNNQQFAVSDTKNTQLTGGLMRAYRQCNSQTRLARWKCEHPGMASPHQCHLSVRHCSYTLHSSKSTLLCTFDTDNHFIEEPFALIDCDRKKKYFLLQLNHIIYCKCLWLGLKWGRWQISLCDPMWQVTLRSSEIGYH